MKVIEVIISPKGETTVQTRGFFGAECQQASKFLEHSLGATVSDQKSAEFYQTAPQTQNEVTA